MTDHHDQDDHDDNEPRRIRYGQVAPIVSALQALAKDGATPEIRAQAGALAVVRVLFPGSRDKPERQHDAYVDVLRALLRAPIAQWPEVAHPLHAAALVLLDDAHELSADECALYFAAFP